MNITRIKVPGPESKAWTVGLSKEITHHYLNMIYSSLLHCILFIIIKCYISFVVSLFIAMHSVDKQQLLQMIDFMCHYSVHDVLIQRKNCSAYSIFPHSFYFLSAVMKSTMNLLLLECTYWSKLWLFGNTAQMCCLHAAIFKWAAAAVEVLPQGKQ